VSSADLLDALKAEPQFAAQLQDPGFEFVVNSHLLLHEIITKHIPLARAPTKGEYSAIQTSQRRLHHPCLSVGVNTPTPTTSPPHHHANTVWPTTRPQVASDLRQLSHSVKASRDSRWGPG
jgi:hypothetical protein